PKQTDPDELLPAAHAMPSPARAGRYGTAWAGRTERSDQPQSPQARRHQIRALNWPSNRERLAAAALGFFIGIAEAKPFIEPFPGVVELCAVQIRQAFRVDEDLHTVTFEDLILWRGLVDVFQLVCQTGTPRGAHTQAQAQALAALLQVATYVTCCVFSQ